MSLTEITKKEAIAAYGGSASALSRALGITRQAVSKLPDGPVPEVWRLKLIYELGFAARASKKNKTRAA